MNAADFAHIKKELKSRRITQAEIASGTGKSISWISVVLNGHYPFYAAKNSGRASLPRDIQRWLVSRGIATEGGQSGMSDLRA